MRALFYDLGYLFTRGSKWGPLVSFLLSLVTAVFQISAFVLIALFIRLLENDNGLDFFGWSIPTGEKYLIKFFIAIPSLLVLSLVFKLYTLTWITREGQKFFDHLAEFTFDLAKRLQLNSGNLDASAISSIIKYDVRYASVSYMHMLRLLYPLFVSIGILTFSYSFEPFLTKIIVISIIVMLPFHILLIKWGKKTADRIREGAIQRSKEVERAVFHIFSHPNKDTVLATKGKIISGSPGNIKFMEAYLDRQRLSGFSGAISDVTMLIAVIIIMWIALGGTISGVLTISNLILGFIIFRFLMSNTSSLLQAITSIGALQPFFYDLLKLISPRAKIYNKIVISDFEPDSAPFTLSIVSFRPFSPWTALSIGEAIDADAQTAILTANFSLNNDEDWQSQLQTTFPYLQERLEKFINGNTHVYGQIRDFLTELEDNPEVAVKMWTQAPIAVRLIILAIIIPESNNTVILNGTDCLGLSDVNWETLHGIIADRNLIFLYNNCPRRLRFGVGGQIAVLSQNKLHIFESKDFSFLVHEIKAMQLRQRPEKDKSKGMEYDM